MGSSLKKSLGLPMLTFYGVGMILGAGIYSIIGKAAGIAEESLWQGFVLAALAAFLTALSYAELATMYPKAGAEYFYLKNAFPTKPWLATSAGLMIFFSGSATVATVALAFAGYSRHFIELPAFLTATGVLAVFTLVNVIGLKESGWFNVVFTLIEIAGLILFISFGYDSEKFAGIIASAPGYKTLSSAALIIFAYFGFENIANLSEEAKDPGRTIPRAIILSIAISTVLYVLVSLSAESLMPAGKLAESGAPLVDAVATRSRLLSRLLGGTALFSTANTALIALITTSRILFGIAKDGALPKVLARTSRRQSPWIAALTALGVSLLLLPLGNVEIVAGVASLTTMAAFLAVHVALIVLRFRASDHARPFRVPLSIKAVPILPIIGSLMAVVFLFQFSMTVYAIGLGCLAAAVGIAVIHGKWASHGIAK